MYVDKSFKYKVVESMTITIDDTVIQVNNTECTMLYDPECALFFHRDFYGMG